MNDDSQQEDRMEEQTRARAYQLWLEEGQPEGRADVHWDMAREIVAQQENYLATTKPIGEAGPVEESLVALDNQGEFPTLTDQGEMETPRKGTPPRR
ncbi:DUF2934 domain-containing protein [Xanthobacter sp. DSM 24535]|uniref:DUF2934 domain-containing protein n=1 Tax=Roseixanthobacter psychrophilus TaxID=3119917 RepID=UPI00372984E3